jgi:hypothetical protein
VGVGVELPAGEVPARAAVVAVAAF